MIDYIEYEKRYAHKIYGKRKARVSDNRDPERRGRVRVENVELFGNGQSAWALPNMPFYGGRDSGFFAVPPIGSLVWLEFEEGLIDYPIYTGGYFDLINDGHSTDGSDVENESSFQNDPSSIPAHGRGVYDGSDFGGLKGSNGVPESTFEGLYGQVTILQTPGGHMIELDDTEGAKRIQIHHSKGAHIEILDDGSINIVSNGKVLTRSENRKDMIFGNHESETAGTKDSTVNGDFSTSVGGSSTFSSVGPASVNVASSEVSIEGPLGLSSDSITANILNAFVVSTGGDIDLSSFGAVDLVSAGSGYLVFNNVTDPKARAVDVIGSSGKARFASSDPTQTILHGVESIVGHVTIGNVSEIPGIEEPAVMGAQLSAFLTAVMTSLETFYTVMSSGGSTPGFGAPNPVLAGASIAALSALTTAKTTFLTQPPVSPTSILSSTVYITRL
jgi:hypothetical protein